MNYLQNRFAISRFVLVGWSYGGAPVFTVGGQDDRVVGCATIASQTAQTEGIREVARRNVPVILLHGRNDRRLGASCSESLHEKYKKTTQGGHSELHLLDGDDHSLTKDPLKAENLLCGFIMKQAGEEIGRKEQEDVVQKALITDEQRKDRMEKGRDLLSESIE
jgi:dienelactone hydrolase